ncbi:MAG: EFR1 family ferrodoxin [Acutalibacteraceae bacterium]
MIFYFTGTGNSLYAAKELDSERYSIPQVLRTAERTFTAVSIGIVAPIYGHEMPDMVKQFIREADFQTDYFFVILTYGNRHANAVELAQEVLTEAGHPADYIRTLWMVDNFLPAFDMEEQIALEKHVEEQLIVIRGELARKTRGLEPVTEADRQAHRNYVRSVNGAPASVWSNFNFTDRCIGCGICTNVCPAGCIHLESGRAIRTGENCQVCMACVHACPEAAIQVLPTLGWEEPNPEARYRNENITLSDLVAANCQRMEVKK